MSDGKLEAKVVHRDAEVLEKRIVLYNRMFKMMFKELEDVLDYYEFVARKLSMIGVLIKAGKWELAEEKLKLIEEELKDKEKEIDWSDEPIML